MEQGYTRKGHTRLPEMFRPIMWSYRFEDIDADKHREEIIVNTINFGSLRHWHWLITHYGKKEIHQVLRRRLATEFNPESRNLARLVFGIN
ncbi:MAG: hypothetical protein ABIH36_03610 [bacterium]